MTSGALLLMVANVIAVQGQIAQVDLGSRDGLIEGAPGRVYYELTVDGERKRIELGRATVTAVESATGTVRVASERAVYPGQRVDFEIMKAPPMSVQRQPARENPSNLPAPEPPSVPILPAESVVQSTAPITGTETSSSAALPERANSVVDPKMETEPSLERSEPAPIATVTIQGGSHWIGLDQAEAEFFNQTPRFSTDVPSFHIDHRPVVDRSGAALRGVNHAEAQHRCEMRGARLPTEVEWEIAAAQGQLEFEDGLLEWTSSWYRPYPGNDRTEAEYGQRFRVLRGSPLGIEVDAHDRRFLAPDRRDGQIGFRCVEEIG